MPAENRSASYPNDTLRALDSVGVRNLSLVGQSLGEAAAAQLSNRSPSEH